MPDIGRIGYMTTSLPQLVPTDPRPHRRDHLPWAVVGWAVGYGGVRLLWAVNGAPEFPPLDADLLVFTGWWAVGLCVAAALVALALLRARSWRPALAGAGWAVSGALVVACPLLLLDLVGMLILDLGPAFNVAAFASRVACLSGAVLLGLATAAYRRRYRGDCSVCGRIGAVAPAGGWSPPPMWAWYAAYAAAAGCVVRLLAQWAFGFGDLPLAEGPSMVAFEIGFLLAGVLLPLALVHSWGRVWPRWVLLLAGRTVSRLLLLVPAFVFSVGLVGYFGVGIGQLTVETLTNTWDPGDGRYPLAFFWVAMPAYWIWGGGLGVAAISYHRRTRRPCRECGR